MHPHLLWAQDKKSIFLTFEVFESKNENVQINEKTINFCAENDQGKYALKDLELYSSINPQESKTVRTDRAIYLTLTKPADSEWWPRLLSAKQKPSFLHTDFARWHEENESDNEPSRLGGGFGDYGGGNFPDMMGGGYNEDDFQDREEDYGDEDGDEINDASIGSDEEEHEHHEDDHELKHEEEKIEENQE